MSTEAQPQELDLRVHKTGYVSPALATRLNSDFKLLEAFIDDLPKAELHIHIEGSLEPELMLKFAKRNKMENLLESIGYKLPISPESDEKFCAQQRAKRRFDNLQEFLDLYYEGCDVMKTEEDFYDLGFAYLEKAAKDSVKHCEVFFDPQTHMFERNTLPLTTVINGLHRACAAAASELGMNAKLVLCFLRHRTEEEALKVLDELVSNPELKSKVLGIGLDSGEQGNPPAKFAKAYELAKNAGFRLTAHAGEEGGPDYITEALDVLHVERIDHGVRCLESKDLVERLRKEKVCLTVCPSSNYRLQVCSRFFKGESPVTALVANDLKICLNGDDPAYFFGHKDRFGQNFGGYINENYKLAAKNCSLSADEVVNLAIDSFEGSFITEEEKQKYKQLIADYCLSFENSVTHST